MSRIGKKPIPVPSGVEISIAGAEIIVKGPKGTLKRTLHPHVSAALETRDGGKEIIVTVKDPDEVRDRALWGLFRALFAGMVEGVTRGFEKKLEVIGIGYKVAGGGARLTLDVGFSHPVEFALPAGVTAAIEKNVITLTGADKEALGETAARIRRIREPEPYKGKGIKYIDEVIRRKAGKAAKAAAK
jgi:large subunit ribosomal protein L6